jgi:hypothetical protein
MGVRRSASFHPAGSWRPTNSSEQSMSTEPMRMPSTPTEFGTAAVWVRPMPVSVVHAPVRR